MNQGVVYLSLWTRLWTQLVVSIYSLRQHCDGKILVLIDDDDRSRKLSSDPSLNVECRRVKMADVRRHTAFSTKTHIHRQVDFDRAVYLDADTLVCGDIAPLFPVKDEMVLTRFSSWVTNARPVRGRLDRWKEIAPQMVLRAQTHPYPAINNGVLGFVPKHPLLEVWAELCQRGHRMFIADEMTLQMLYPDYDCRIVDDRYNSSPTYGINQDRTVIWHGHGAGMRCLKGKMRAPWLKAFSEVASKNIGGVMDVRGEDLQQALTDLEAG